MAPGDSGSPLLAATGEALSVVTHVRPGFVSSDARPLVAGAAGTRLAHGIALTEAATGLDLEVATAPVA